jgi:hypothetical protein
MNIKGILKEMQTIVENGEIMPPHWWMDKAIQLSALWQDLKDELTKAEINYLSEVNRLSDEFDYSDAKATKKAKAIRLTPEQEEENKITPNKYMTPYQKYQYMEGRDKIIKEFIMLAKRRATIEGQQF